MLACRHSFQQIRRRSSYSKGKKKGEEREWDVTGNAVNSIEMKVHSFWIKQPEVVTRSFRGQGLDQLDCYWIS